MKSIYKKGDPSISAYLVKGGTLRVGISGGKKTEFPGDGIIVGTLEHFLQKTLGERVPRIFDLLISPDGVFEPVSFDTVNEMMLQYKFGCNTNIFIARLIEFCTVNLIKKSKTPLGVLRKYKRRAGAFARNVDLLFDLGVRYNNPSILKLAKEKKCLEVYKDGSIQSHYTEIEAITSPAKDRSEYIKLFKKNALICREGSIGRELYILLEGAVNVTYDNLFVAHISKPGEAFGEMSLFLNKKRSASLVADVDSHLYILPYSQISEFSKNRCPDLFLKIAQGLSQRLAVTLQGLSRIETLILKAESKNDPGKLQADLEKAVESQATAFEKDVLALSAKIDDPKISSMLKPLCSGNMD